jgi:hypothetical protein
VILFTLVCVLSSCSIINRKQLRQTQKQYRKDNYFALSIKNEQLKKSGIYELLYTIDESKGLLCKKVKHSPYGNFESDAQVKLENKDLMFLDMFMERKRMESSRVYYGESYLFHSRAEVVMAFGDYTDLLLHGNDDIFDHKHYRTALEIQYLLDEIIEKRTKNFSEAADESEM